MPQYSFEIGRYQGRPYFISTRCDPDYLQPTDFAVTLYYQTAQGDTVDVARIDNSHGGVHFDRLFLDKPDKQPLSLSWQDAEDKLRANWRTYAKQYQSNHGGP